MTTVWSQSEEALRDTLVHKAERGAFSRIASHYGFSWPEALDERAWRGALKEVGYGPRDTFPTVFKALNKALSQFRETETVTIKAGESDRVYFPGNLSTTYIGRYIRIDGVVYYSTDVDNDALILSTYRTSYWAAAAFDVASDTDVTCDILPFVVYERTAGPSYTDPYLTGDPDDSWEGETHPWSKNSTLEVEVWPQVGFSPASYLYAPTEYLTATPGTCPADGGDVCTPSWMKNGGYILANDTEDIGVPPATAYPVYLTDGTVAPELKKQFDRLLCAGNWVEMYASVRTDSPAPF